MKKLLVLTALALTSVLAMGQGAQLAFGNRATGVDAPVTLSGVKVEGTAWSAQLYWGTTAGSLAPVGPVLNFRTGAAAGYISTTAVSVAPTATANVAGFAQMVVWQSSLGASWAAAGGATGAANTGASNVLPITALVAPATPPNMVGLNPIAVIPVPEPTTIALGLLGLGVLALRRRK
jgi:hypothetical protein